MAPRAPRKGFGYDPEGHHTGFRDGVGHRYRSGTAEFVWVAFEWADQYEDVAPAYVLRYMHWPGDEYGEYRMMAEIAWCYNYRMIEAEDFDLSVVPDAEVAALRADDKAYWLTPYKVAIEFVAITSLLRTRGCRPRMILGSM